MGYIMICKNNRKVLCLKFLQLNITIPSFMGFCEQLALFYSWRHAHKYDAEGPSKNPGTSTHLVSEPG